MAGNALIKLRRDTAANWASANPTLGEGEPAIETDTRNLKWGDGVTAWNSLPYAYVNPSVAPSDIAGTTYSLVLTDMNGYKRATNVAGCAITVPAEASVDFPIGTVISIRAATAATVSLVADLGVTFNKVGGAAGTLDLAEEGATAQIKKVASDEWDLIGGMA